MDINRLAELAGLEEAAATPRNIHGRILMRMAELESKGHRSAPHVADGWYSKDDLMPEKAVGDYAVRGAGGSPLNKTAHVLGDAGYVEVSRDPQNHKIFLKLTSAGKSAAAGMAA